eukprot:scaffold127958_cov57-Phaeocystis_antarctica.AAC.5
MARRRLRLANVTGARAARSGGHPAPEPHGASAASKPSKSPTSESQIYGFPSSRDTRLEDSDARAASVIRVPGAPTCAFAVAFAVAERGGANRAALARRPWTHTIHRRPEPPQSARFMSSRPPASSGAVWRRNVARPPPPPGAAARPLRASYVVRPRASRET